MAAGDGFDGGHDGVVTGAGRIDDGDSVDGCHAFCLSFGDEDDFHRGSGGPGRSAMWQSGVSQVREAIAQSHGGAAAVTPPAVGSRTDHIG
ncbi:MAG: hypothetical protein ACRD0P_29250 [Stackebrandtia sp.]